MFEAEKKYIYFQLYRFYIPAGTSDGVVVVCLEVDTVSNNLCCSSPHLEKQIRLDILGGYGQTYLR